VYIKFNKYYKVTGSLYCRTQGEDVQVVENFGNDLPGYCLKCVKFGHFFLRKIIKFVATRCQILRLKCTKIDFGWGSAPDPAGGAYSAPPDPLAGFKGAYF